MNPIVIISIAFSYVALLFFIAWFTEKRNKEKRSIVNNPYIYALSISVYCTAWTFYGSVGKAADSGISFLPIYLGPTIMACVWWFVLRKIIVISKYERITSIADFISSRYGKSLWLGVIATVIAVASIVPYISIQLKAVAVTYDFLLNFKDAQFKPVDIGQVPFYLDSALYIAIALSIFTILFGTRNLDPNERHEGLVAVVAFEAVIKLVAFLVVGGFVTYGLFNGFGDLLVFADSTISTKELTTLSFSTIDSWSWFWLTLLSMSAILFLPRQFHMMVVENTNPNHISTAAWIFPLYLLLINLFVLPIAIGGLALLGTSANPDFFVLSIPLLHKSYGVALLAGLGGFSAATGMVVVSVIALSIMINNNLVLPFLLRSQTKTPNVLLEKDLTNKLIGIRRVSIVFVFLFAYGYFKFVSSQYSLVSIGLISFAGVAQFAPVMLGGIFWKRGTRIAAICSLVVGFLTWGWCLAFPTLAEVGVISSDFIENGPLGISLLKPYSLFGLEGLNRISHGAFWSLLLNTLTYAFVSINTHPSILEITQADLFVNIYKYKKGGSDLRINRRKAKMSELLILMYRFLGQERTDKIFKKYERNNNINLSEVEIANEDIINFTEVHLAGAIGGASSKIILNSVVQEEAIRLEEMFKLLEQTQEAIQYSKELEEKSKALENTTEQLKEANEQLKKLDGLKADFITTITHELRTPITSVKALSKILHDNMELPDSQRKEYLTIIVNESERITRLVNQVLDLEKLDQLKHNTKKQIVDFVTLTENAFKGLQQLMSEKQILATLKKETTTLSVYGDEDQLTQVIINLLSNAIKFCAPVNGIIELVLKKEKDNAILSVKDNGIGVAPENSEIIFEKFTQLSTPQFGKPKGTGLGLTISKEIITHHNGTIEIQSKVEKGACFIIRIPIQN